MLSKDEKPSVNMSPEAAAFWEGAAKGQLVIRTCGDCAKPHFYPRPICPFCSSPRTEPLVSSGRGTVYSFAPVLGSRRPTAAAIVELAEGPKINSLVVDSDVHQLAIGEPVEVRFFADGEGRSTLGFTTAAAQRARGYSTRALKASSLIDGEAATNSPAPAEIKTAAIVGAGTMGSGITLSLLAAGIAVHLVDSDSSALERARERIRKILTGDVARGRRTEQEASSMESRVSFGRAIDAVSEAELVIEAVWEQMSLKRAIFGEIDRYAKGEALLGSNTSTLDIDQIASATGRPESLIGLHFFSPAHVMKLLEVIRGPRTSKETIQRAMALGSRINKVPVLVRTCNGFVGNRLMIAREEQAGRLLLEGASPQQVDRVLRAFGLPMGTFELQDMAGGIELSYRHRQETGEQNWLIDQLFERGRLGQKTGKGYYRYEPGSSKPVPDREVDDLIVEGARRNGVTRRVIPDDEVRDRLVFPMINEAAKLIEENIVQRPSDIDVVWQHGYGWPNWKGGPVYWADQIGLRQVRDKLRGFALAYDPNLTPANLLNELADRDGKFLDQAER